MKPDPFVGTSDDQPRSTSFRGSPRRVQEEQNRQFPTRLLVAGVQLGSPDT